MASPVLSADSMPSTESESKIKTTVYLPQETLDIVASIAKTFGLNSGELLRTALITGVTALAESSNKVLVHKKLARELERIEVKLEEEGE